MTSAGTMARKMPDRELLERVIEDDIALPRSPGYERSPRPFNARFHEMEPKAIVSCATSQDIAETISFARRHSLEIAARSGGQSFAGHSSTRVLGAPRGPAPGISAW